MKIEGLWRDVCWGAGSITVAIVAYMIGNSAGRATSLDAAAVASLTNAKAWADSELSKSNESLSANKTRLAKLEGYEAKVTKLQNQIASSKQEVSSLTASPLISEVNLNR